MSYQAHSFFIYEISTLYKLKKESKKIVFLKLNAE